MTAQSIISVINITLIYCNYYAFLWSEIKIEFEYQKGLIFILIETIRNLFMSFPKELYEIFFI